MIHSLIRGTFCINNIPFILILISEKFLKQSLHIIHNILIVSSCSLTEQTNEIDKKFKMQFIFFTNSFDRTSLLVFELFDLNFFDFII